MIRLIVALISFAVALWSGFAFRSIYPGDPGDLVTAAVQGGVPHPPGYPLYTLLGWLFTRVSWQTPAWQMSWLSILPHAITVGLVAYLVFRWTKQILPTVFAALLLIGNYLFFLYSITPEVFALLDLFVIVLLCLAILLREKFSWKQWYVFLFTVGLSITHHHLVVFLFPALFVHLRQIVFKQSWNVRRVLTSVGVLIAGLLPYTYVVIAGHGNAMVNWDKPTTLARFIQLFTRADYGTFVNGGVVGKSMYERLLNVKALFTFLVVDFTWIGIVLVLVGAWWLWRNKRDIFTLLATAFLFLGPGFLFYASFSVINRFVLGTYERFLLPSYVLMAVLCGIGVWQMSAFFGTRISLLLRKKTSATLWSTLCIAVLLLYPLTIGAMNIWRFWGSSSDQTSELFLQDLFASAPPNAIVLLSHDTPLFGAQYMRYGRNIREDLIVLHLSRLPLSDYHEVLHQVHPELVLPDVAPEQFFSAFLEANSARPIATNMIIPTRETWTWVPHGLLFILTKKDAVPDNETLVSENASLWESFSHPTDGLLGRYNHLMLSNVRDEYASASIEYGKILINAGSLTEAKKQFERATTYESDSQHEAALMYLGLSQLFLKECDASLVSFAQSREAGLSPNPELYQYEAIAYRDCVGDEVKAKERYTIYEELMREKEQPLEQL